MIVSLENKEKLFDKRFFLILLLLCLLNINLILSYIVFFLIILLFINIPLKRAFSFYAILLPWERGLDLPGIGTLTTLVQLILLILIFASKSGHLRRIFPLILYMLYALVCLIFNNNYAGFGLMFEFLLITLIFDPLDDNVNKKVWPEMCKAYVVSTIVSCFFGVAHGMFDERWIDGLGRVTTFVGIQGANQTGFCINIAVLLLLSSPITIKRKLLGLTVLVLFLFSTISITSIICLIIGILGCVLLNCIDLPRGPLSLKTKIWVFIFIVSFIVAFIMTPFGKPITYRIENMITDFQVGDFTKATTARVGLNAAYLAVFNKLPLFNKLFGLAEFSRKALLNQAIFIQYSHNTLIDMIFYTGIIGVMIQIVVSFSSVFYCKDKPMKNKLFVLKCLVLIEAFSLSIYTESFWLSWFFL